MKKDIHPQLNKDTLVTCACGNTFVTQSTQKAISVEICSNCHPFYTGKQKFIDTEGRIDKFEKKRKTSEIKKQEVEARNAKKSSKKDASSAAGTPSLKDLMQQAKESQ